MYDWKFYCLSVKEVTTKKGEMMFVAGGWLEKCENGGSKVLARIPVSCFVTDLYMEFHCYLVKPYFREFEIVGLFNPKHLGEFWFETKLSDE